MTAKFELKSKQDDSVISTLEYDMSKVYGVLSSSEPLSAPENLEYVQLTSSFVSVRCDAVTGAINYQWYVDGSPVKTTAAPDASLDVTPGARIIGVQAIGAVVSSSITTLNIVVPTAAAPSWQPISDQALIISSNYDFDLSQVSSDPDSPVLTYSIVGGALPPGLALTNVSHIAGTPLTAGAYSATVRVSDGVNTADTTITFTVSAPDVTGPTVPVLSATLVGLVAQLTWTPSTDTESGLSYYEVERSVDGSPFTSRASNIQVAEYSDNVTAGISVRWRVRARDFANNWSSYSNTVEIVVPTTSTLQPPTSVEAETWTDGDNILIQWVAPTTGPTPDGYTLYRQSLTNPNYWWPRDLGNVTGFVDGALHDGTWSYYIVSYLADGTVSAPSNTVTAIASTTDGGTQPPPSGSIRWHPGHYSRFGKGDSLTTRLNAMTNEQNISSFVGYSLWYSWKDLEPTQGVYNIGPTSDLGQMITRAEQVGKKVLIDVICTTFGSTNFNDIPTWVVNTGLTYTRLAPTPAAGPRYWDTFITDRLILLYKAIVDQWGSNVAVAALVTGESSIGPTSELSDEAFTVSAFVTQKLRLITTLRAYAPHIPFIFRTNWFSGEVANKQYMLQAHEQLRTTKGCFISGGPDALTDSTGSSNTSDGWNSQIGAIGPVDHRGLYPIHGETQFDDLTLRNSTPQIVYDKMVTTGRANYMIWARGNASAPWNPTILNFIQSRPTVTTLPTNYGTTTSPPTPGTLLFDGGMENYPVGVITGNIDSGATPEDGFARSVNGSDSVVAVVSSPVLEGSRAFRSLVNYTGPTLKRAELRVRSPSDNYSNDGSNISIWTGFAFMFLRWDSVEVIPGQWHHVDFTSGGNPPCAWIVDQNGILRLWGRSSTGSVLNASTVFNVATISIALNTKYRLVTRHVWDGRANGNGRVEAWVNSTKYVDYVGPIGYVGSNGSEPTKPYFKWGQYKYAYRYQTPSGDTSCECIHDSLRIMGNDGSFAAVSPP